MLRKNYLHTVRHINDPFFEEVNTMDTMDFVFACSGAIRGMSHNYLG